MQKSLNLQELKEKYRLVKLHPAFSQLAYDAARKVAQSLVILQYRKNAPVFNENDPQNMFFIVRTGEFKMTKRVMPKQQEKFFLFKIHTFEICLLERGETFGLEFFDELGSLYSFSVRCNSFEGSLFAVHIPTVKAILQLQSIQRMFTYAGQQMKDKLYKERVSLLQILSLQQKDVKSISQHQNSPRVRQKQLRSISSDTNYCDKIEGIIKGNMIPTKLKTEQDLNESIIAKMKELQLTTSQEDMVNKRRNEQEERLQKIKIMNHLGYRPRGRPIIYRSINYKKLLMN